MDKNIKNTKEVSSNDGFLKVNLSAISFYERDHNNSLNLNETLGNVYKSLIKCDKRSTDIANNTTLCKSSSCCVVFSLKLLSGSSKHKDYWTLCSEVITRPLFVKYKRNDKGYISFLTNHTEVLRFGKATSVESIKPVDQYNKHFGSVIDTDRFLLSIGVSIVKKSKLLYMGYGNKYLSSVDLFGKRLSVGILGDKNNNSLNLDSGLLFFDLYVKRTHLVPIPNSDIVAQTESAENKGFGSDKNQDSSNDLLNNLNGLISNKKLDIEACLKDTKLLSELQLDDYTTSSSYVDSVSEVSSVKKVPLSKKKVLPPPRPKNDNSVPDKQVVHVHSNCTHSVEDSNNTKSGASKDFGQKNDEVHPEFCENFNADSKYDKNIKGVKVTFNKDFVELIDSLAPKKYANLSQTSSSLLNGLNLETSRLKGNESRPWSAKPERLSSISPDGFSFKVFLKFVNLNGGNDDRKIMTDNGDDVDAAVNDVNYQNYQDIRNQSIDGGNENECFGGEHESLGVILNELFLFSNKVFLISNTKGTYDTVWIKTRSSASLENIIKIPISTSSSKMGELFDYLSKISLSSVYGVGFLVDLRVDLFALEVFISILEDKIGNMDLNIPIKLTDVVFSLNCTDFLSYFDDALDHLSSKLDKSSSATHSNTISSHSSSAHLYYQDSLRSNVQVESAGPVWTNILKKEIGSIREENSIHDNFLKFIWPSYGKQLA
ncbi:hypothetical protein TOT_030000355 [Theileria orientalis strain Shintoku]|uniref:Uncharacterized protein n=1 Tax=Theileria orientalis strain Shintoku TaxID=869250 RepID=J4CDG3_THEOR|nr:hypothetical protein TOT_030000355 [Theileria orientalis strain Shintoku]BAM41092.1 hypothetical protein TOT_030000355 [Theileria orientalis strain Shintoku]|eukprot:XP_009691393.1 hypothetical protein TOT_030000355 [Theileria orientalis strain Shintoku]